MAHFGVKQYKGNPTDQKEGVERDDDEIGIFAGGGEPLKIRRQF